MIGSVADLNINIGGQVFRLKDLFGKTLYATRDVDIYKTYLSRKPIAKVKSGAIVGRVQGYIANGYKGARMPFLIIGENSRNTQVVPYLSSNFSASKLEAQGVKTVGELVRKDEAEAQPWYIKSLKTIAPWAAIGIVGYSLIKRKVL
jgi:hypothetical protein